MSTSTSTLPFPFFYPPKCLVPRYPITIPCQTLIPNPTAALTPTATSTITPTQIPAIVFGYRTTANPTPFPTTTPNSNRLPLPIT